MPPIEVTPADRREFQRIKAKVDSLRGVGVVNTHDAIVISPPPPAPPKGVPSPPFKMPAPTRLYQVYTPVDYTLKPVWTSCRFTSDGTGAAMPANTSSGSPNTSSGSTNTGGN